MIKKILWAYGALVVVIVLIALMIGLTFNTQHYQAIEEEGFYVLNGWKSSISGQSLVNSDSILSNAQSNQKVAYWRNLPTNKVLDSCLVFYSKHQEVEIYIGDQLIYSHHTGENAFGKTPGSLWNIIDIPKSYEGKTITICLMSPYSDMAKIFPKMYFGDKYAIMSEIRRDYMLSISISVCILIMGIIIVSLWFIVHRKLKIERAFLYLGLFAVTFALWTINENRLTTLILNGALWLAYFNYFYLILPTVPLLLFMREIYPKRLHGYWEKACIAWLGVSLCCILLQVMNLFDFKQTLFIIHATLIIIIIGIVIVTVKVLTKENELRSMKTYYVYNLLVTIAVVGDILCYRFHINVDVSFYTRLAILITIILLGIDGLIKTLDLFQLGQYAQEYKDLAFNDPLTGLSNRVAMVNDMQRKYTSQKDIVVFMFDLNNLKECNDQKGHNIGDEYILASARILEEVLADSGNCYRIGGDEFCYIVEGVDSSWCQQLMLELNEKVAHFNKKHLTFKMEIAWGYAVFNPKLDKNLDQTRNRADYMMYQNKKHMKKSKHERELLGE